MRLAIRYNGVFLSDAGYTDKKVSIPMQNNHHQTQYLPGGIVVHVIFYDIGAQKKTTPFVHK